MSCLVFALPEVKAVVVISNVPATTDGGSTLLSTSWKALRFTSGPSAGEIDLLELSLNPRAGTSLPATLAVQVSLFSVVDGLPTTSLASTDLLPVEISATRQLYPLAIPPGFELAAQTAYALVVSSDVTGLRWANNIGHSPTGSEGFQFNGFLVSDDSGLTWNDQVGNENVLRLGFTAVCEPESGSVALGMGLLLAVAAWQHSRPHRIPTSP